MTARLASCVLAFALAALLLGSQASANSKPTVPDTSKSDRHCAGAFGDLSPVRDAVIGGVSRLDRGDVAGARGRIAALDLALEEGGTDSGERNGPGWRVIRRARGLDRALVAMRRPNANAHLPETALLEVVFAIERAEAGRRAQAGSACR